MIVRLSGAPREQGLRHAAAMPPEARGRLLALVAEHRPGAAAAALLDVSRADAPETVETVEGLARGLGTPFEALWAYTVRGYVSDLGCDGCSVAARAGRRPLLGKNRDFAVAHAPLQAVVAVAPEIGHPWVSLGSLGSPGVYSSGMNAAGLAVADAFVSTADLGPGVLRYSLMQQVLERYADVPGAVAHLSRARSAHGGAVVLADAAGRAACVELAHGRAAVRRRPSPGWLTATNHFRHPRMRLRNRPAEDDDSSRPRAARLARLLPGVDTAGDLLEGLASHAGGAGRLCRHGYGALRDRATLASAVYEPLRRALLLRAGRPCEAATVRVEWTGEGWALSETRPSRGGA